VAPCGCYSRWIVVGREDEAHCRAWVGIGWSDAQMENENDAQSPLISCSRFS
jgi:hypothetical protein